MATAVLVAAPITSPRASKLEMGGVLTKNVPAATTTQLGLPEEMCRALEETRKRSPRFLFRGYSDRSGGGLSKKLNTTDAITPHCFLDGHKPEPHASMEAFSAKDLHAGLHDHLRTKAVPTEFSSWAVSIERALLFAKNRGNDNQRLVVIDTHKLDREVYAFHAPALGKVIEKAPPGISEGGLSTCYSGNTHEYLIHGKLSGHGLYTIALDNKKHAIHRNDSYKKTQQSRQPWKSFYTANVTPNQLKLGKFA